MAQPTNDSVEVADLCSSLSETITQNGNVLTLNIKTFEAELVPDMDLTAEIIPNSSTEMPIPKCLSKKEKKFKCSSCDFAFSLSGDLKRHEMTHTGLKQFKCDVCDSAFARAATLKIHKMRHSGEKPFPCDICGAAFALNSRLKRHKMSHTGERPFRCDICGHTFIVSRDLKVHQMTHAERENKNYSCDLCGTKFAHKSSVKAHIKTSHADTTPFKCKICGLAFQVSDELREHKKLHIGEKIFKCDICGNSFARKLTLRRHELTHSGVKNYHCDICGTSFSRRNTLKIHRMTHTGDKPFKCHICTASFALNVRLKRHMMIHSGERPFKCNVCGAAFALSNRLKRHKTTHLIKSHKNNQQHSKSPHETVKISATKKIPKLRTKKENKLFVCQTCGNEFLHVKHFKKHVLGHALNGGESSTSEIKRQESDSARITEKKRKEIFSCGQCQFSTVSNSKFEQHKQKHNRQTNSIKSHNYDTRHSSRLPRKICIVNGNITLQKKTKEQESIIGDISCVEKLHPKDSSEKQNHSFIKEHVSQNILTDHQLTHISNENKNCNSVVCDANTKLPEYETAHTEMIHQCVSCDSISNSEIEITSHTKTHTDDNPAEEN